MNPRPDHGLPRQIPWIGKSALAEPAGTGQRAYQPPRLLQSWYFRALAGWMQISVWSSAGRAPHPTWFSIDPEQHLSWLRKMVGEPCWTRTSDPLLKRQMLYRLS